ALSADLTPTHLMITEFKKRKAKVLELVKDFQMMQCNEPDGAFYIFPSVKKYFGKKIGETVIANADDLCMYLLNTAHVSTVTGSAFGNPDCIRISFANSMEKIEEGFTRIKDGLGKLV
ncbi:MAG: aminotransferase class I/II-fold pyridoxal phosphate-dependent enzyme, partial [Ginsengibacter sp.]